MMIKKYKKPDFLFVLAVIVGLGVIISMKAQPGAANQTSSVSSPVSVASTK